MQHAEHAKRVHLRGDRWPAAVIITGLTLQRPDAEPLVYPLPFNASIDFGDMLEQRVQQFLAGRLAPHRRSERAPTATEATAAAPVEIVTGASFDADVLHTNAEVLLEFYSPSCAACAHLEPRLREAAMLIGDALGADALVVRKLDASGGNAWDKARFPVAGFPTVYFVTNDKRVVAFDSSSSSSSVAVPTVDELLAFVRVHSAHASRLVNVRSVQHEAAALAAQLASVSDRELARRIRVVLQSHQLHAAALHDLLTYKAVHDSHHHHTHHHDHEHGDHDHADHEHTHEHTHDEHSACGAGKCSAHSRHDEL